MKKKIISIIVCFTLVCGITAHAAPEISSRGACVVNAATGEIYYEFNADEPLAPASMTKVMTAYIVYREIDGGALTKQTMITADAEDAWLSRDPEATNVEIIEGESYSVDEILGAILVPSACAACEMIGKYLCGSESAFAELMNQTAGELGLEAYYTDASGLSDYNRISARSMAKLAARLINEYPDVLNYTSRPTIMFGGREYKTTNRLLPGGAYQYWGADGLKTGTTTLAGYCNTATALRDGIRVISVTMHSESGSERFTDSISLLDMGFDAANYYYSSLLSTNIRLFLNGYEVPAFFYRGPERGLCFIIEDLKDYGFDIDWDEAAKAVTAYKNPDKAVTAIPMDMYRAYPDGSRMFNVMRNTGITARIVCGDKEYTFKQAYNLSGYTAVSADELSSVGKSCVWNEAERLLDVVID